MSLQLQLPIDQLQLGSSSVRLPLIRARDFTKWMIGDSCHYTRWSSTSQDRYHTQTRTSKSFLHLGWKPVMKYRPVAYASFKPELVHDNQLKRLMRQSKRSFGSLKHLIIVFRSCLAQFYHFELVQYHFITQYHEQLSSVTFLTLQRPRPIK